jgi:two-component system sensor kinase FixL
MGVAELSKWIKPLSLIAHQSELPSETCPWVPSLPSSSGVHFKMTESLHNDLFNIAPVGIVCEDWSLVRRALLERVCTAAELDRFLSGSPSDTQELRKLHKFVCANDAAIRLLGLPSKGDFVQSAPESFLTDQLSNGQVLRAIFEGAKECHGDITLKAADGRMIPVVWKATLPQNGKGYDRLYFFIIDILDLKRPEEALSPAHMTMRQAARLSLMGELTASIAHEITQPISAIGASASAARRWLARDPPNPAEAMANVRRISESAEYATQVVRRIKDFTRRNALSTTPLLPKEVITDAIALIAHEAQRHQAAISSDVAECLPDVMADKVQVQQVLVNLLLNALQAMSGADVIRRCVKVSAYHERSAVIFSVVDTGPGITQDVEQLILRPFQSSKTEGLGLGLSICRRIVEEHGGCLWIDSTAPGGQVCFSLSALKDATQNSPGGEEAALVDLPWSGRP